MATKLYWLDETWPGRVALSARPRGGDWLEDEIVGWKQAGISTVISLLEAHEEQELALQGEAAEIRHQNMGFVSFPIPDRHVPRSEAELADALEKVEQSLAGGKNVLIHCRQGVGRTGLIAACLLVKEGMSPGSAVERISAARGVVVPETDEQREWIDHFSVAPTK